jgi:subtilisin family serine protease
VNNYRGRDASGNFDHNYNWFDTIDGAQVPYDDFDDGHGTHTLGTALGTNGIGVAPGAKWISVRAVDPQDPNGTNTDIIEAMQFMLAPTDLQGQNANPDLRPDVVGNSWRPYGSDYVEDCRTPGPNVPDPALSEAWRRLG